MTPCLLRCTPSSIVVVVVGLAIHQDVVQARSASM